MHHLNFVCIIMYKVQKCMGRNYLCVNAHCNLTIKYKHSFTNSMCLLYQHILINFCYRSSWSVLNNLWTLPSLTLFDTLQVKRILSLYSVVSVTYSKILRLSFTFYVQKLSNKSFDYFICYIISCIYEISESLGDRLQNKSCPNSI